MNSKCLLCNNSLSKSVFPWKIKFNNEIYSYKKCSKCSSVSVDPIPNNNAFKVMYSKEVYHDCHYYNKDKTRYDFSAKLLLNYASNDSLVLDYGCGVGYFLDALINNGFNTAGVEFDKNIIYNLNNKILFFTFDEFYSSNNKLMFDVIHLGDVLEHIPDPNETINKLLKYLKPNGILFIEGPIENNHSLVYYCSLLFGYLKKFLIPNYIGLGTPWHLYRVNENQQKRFFEKFSKLKLLHWEVLENGGPYINNGYIRNLIAKLAILMSGFKISKYTFGNNFISIFKKI